MPIGFVHGSGTTCGEAAAASTSCHMLWFLAGCAQVGVLAKNAHGKLAMTSVTLRPKVAFVGNVDAATLADLHHEAHDACFIASSSRSLVDAARPTALVVKSRRR